MFTDSGQGFREILYQVVRGIVVPNLQKQQVKFPNWTCSELNPASYNLKLSCPGFRPIHGDIRYTNRLNGTSYMLF